MQALKKNDKTPSLSHAKLTKLKVSRAEENKAMGSSRKMVEELEASLKEAQEGWKKIKDDLCEMRLKSFALSKEYEKAMQVSFKKTLQPVEYFYPEVHISREKVCLDQEMVKEDPVSDMNEVYLLAIYI